MSTSSDIIAAMAAAIVDGTSNSNNTVDDTNNHGSGNVTSAPMHTTLNTNDDDDIYHFGFNASQFISGEDPFTLKSPIITSMILYLITSIVAFLEYYHSLASSAAATSSLQQSNSNSAANAVVGNTMNMNMNMNIPHNSNHSSQFRDGDDPNMISSKSRNSSYNGRGRTFRRGDSSNSPVDINPNGPDGNTASNGTSPSDMKSPGEENRRLFYKYLSISLVLRLILLPVQQTFTNAIIKREHRHHVSHTEDDTVNTDINDDNNITITVAQSLPILTSMISYTILICFYAQVTFIATGRIQNMQVIQKLKQSFVQVVYSIYASIIFFNSVIPTISNVWLDILIWTMMCLYHLCLCCSMAYFGSSLTSILKSSLAGGLGLRLVSMSIVCATMFFLRFALEGFKVLNTVNGFVIERREDDYSFSENTYRYENVILFPIHLDFGAWDTSFGRDVMGYITLEWLPAVFVLIMMHRASNKNHKNNHNGEGGGGNGNGNSGNGNVRVSRVGGIGIGADDTMNALEGGQYSPVLDPVDLKPKSGLMVMSGGVKKSYSANGGIPITTRSMLNQNRQHQQSSSGQRAVAGSFGMLRTGSAGGSSGGGETTSLLGEKSNSAFASSSNTAQSYGAANHTDD